MNSVDNKFVDENYTAHLSHLKRLGRHNVRLCSTSVLIHILSFLTAADHAEVLMMNAFE